ncbi:hypothetical protein IPH25_03825 [bacterium]|nr:MAG: hypothetical protein IPG37_00820 [bacterium]QQR61580.1 MAG: hypothetical protein IPH25_03825 [bacterium]QQR62884.1 MAG: hypothetical protein IPH67_00120 [bacterium]
MKKIIIAGIMTSALFGAEPEKTSYGERIIKYTLAPDTLLQGGLTYLSSRIEAEFYNDAIEKNYNNTVEKTLIEPAKNMNTHEFQEHLRKNATLRGKDAPLIKALNLSPTEANFNANAEAFQKNIHNFPQYMKQKHIRNLLRPGKYGPLSLLTGAFMYWAYLPN